MKFSFINPGPNIELPVSEKKKMIGACPPLGILYIATMLRNEGIEVSMIDHAAEGLSAKEIVDWVKKENPDILGLSTYASSGQTAATLAREVKKENPNVTIVLGNFHATFNADRILERYPFIDIVVRGEGEFTCKDLAKSLEKRKDLKDILGITFREKERVVSTSDRPLIRNIDSLPFPDRELLDVEYHNTTAGINVAPKKFTTFVSSRGCVFKCRFCGCRRLSRNLWRTRSVENILEELHLITSEGYEQLMFVDDNFTLNQKRTIEICRRIRKEHIDLEWICEGRVDQSSYDMFREMVKAGCKMLYFGIESANQKILDYYRKKITPEQSRDAVKVAKRAGVDVIVGSFIVGAPSETKQEIENTLKFAEQLNVDIPQFNILTAFPGTDIWDELSMKGFLDEQRYWETGANVPEIFPGAVSIDDINDMIHRHYRHFLLRPSYISKQMLFSLKSSYRINVILSSLSRLDMIAESLRDIKVR